MKKHTVIPGILARTKEDFTEKIAILEPLSKQIHVDLADGQVVASRTLPLQDILVAQTASSFILHMMVASPRQYLQHIPDDHPFEELIFHLDWEEKPYYLFDYGQERKIDISVAISPLLEGAAGVADVAPFVEMVKTVMVMGVVPGFSGQPFRREVLKTVIQLHKEFPDLTIAIDGGMNAQTIPQILQAGARVVYATSAVLRSSDPKAAFKNLQEVE